MLRAEQAIDGIPVFQSDTRFILDREGRLIRTTGRLVSPAGAGGTAPAAAIPAAAAFASAMQSVGIAVSASAKPQLRSPTRAYGACRGWCTSRSRRVCSSSPTSR